VTKSCLRCIGEYLSLQLAGNRGGSGLERALELTPNDLASLTSFVHFLAYLEEYERSIEIAQRVVELDPSQHALAHAYLYAGDFESAYIAWTNLLRFDINKTDSAVHRSLAIVEWHRDNKDSAIINIKAAERLLTTGPVVYAEQIQVYGMLGLQDDADRLFRIFEQMADTFQIPAFTWVLAYTGIGEYEKALRLLNRIDVDRSPEDSRYSFQFAINRRHDPVFEQPEFVDMRNKLRLKR